MIIIIIINYLFNYLFNIIIIVYSFLSFSSL